MGVVGGDRWKVGGGGEVTCALWLIVVGDRRQWCMVLKSDGW